MAGDAKPMAIESRVVELIAQYGEIGAWDLSKNLNLDELDALRILKSLNEEGRLSRCSKSLKYRLSNQVAGTNSSLILRPVEFWRKALIKLGLNLSDP